MSQRWYDKSIQQAGAKLKTNLYGGLSRKEAARRLKQYRENIITPRRKEAFATYLKQLMTDLTSLLLVVTAVIAAVFEHSNVAVLMIALLIFNYGAALLVYVKSQRVFERMEAYAVPNAKVLRDGKLYMIRQERLVPGDVICLAAGDIVPADARLIETDELYVLESSLTGESGAVQKDASFCEFRDIAPARQKNMVFASSIVTAGTGRAVVCATGSHTLCYAVSRDQEGGSGNKFMPQDKLKVFESLRGFSRVLGLVMLGVIGLLVLLWLMVGGAGHTLYETFLLGLCLAVSSMSEFFTAFGYIIIGCGVFNLIHKYKEESAGALIKNPAILDQLKDLTYLIVPQNGIFLVKDTDIESVYADGTLTPMASLKAGELTRGTESVLRYAVISTGLYGSERLLDLNLRHENVRTAEEDAVIRAAQATGVYNVELEEQYPVVDHVGVSAVSRFETTLVNYGGGYVIAVRGEPHAILRACSSYCENGKIYPMEFVHRNDLMLKADELTKNGHRVIAVASKNSSYSTLRRIGACQSELIFEGFLAIDEPLLRDAALTVSKCRAAGIRVIMMCEEHSINNTYVAQATGVLGVGEQVVTSAQIATMKRDLFLTNIPLYSVYECLTTAQKRNLVEILQKNGEKVGWLGSGLHDVILEKDADVSFSATMIPSEKARRRGLDLTGRNVPVFLKNASRGAGGASCEAVRYLSDVMVSEADRHGSGGINAVVEAVSGARVIFRNVNRMVRYLMTSQLARLLLVLWSFFRQSRWLPPVQILFCGIVVDFVCVLIIGFERPSSDILKLGDSPDDFLIRPWVYCADTVGAAVLWAGLTVLMARLIVAFGLSLTVAETSSCVFVSYVLTQIVVLSETLKEKSLFIRNSVHLNGLHLFSIAALVAFAGVLLLVRPVGRLFSVVRPAQTALFAALLVPALMFGAYELYKVIASRSFDPAKLFRFSASSDKENERSVDAKTEPDGTDADVSPTDFEATVEFVPSKDAPPDPSSSADVPEQPGSDEPDTGA